MAKLAEKLALAIVLCAMAVHSQSSISKISAGVQQQLIGPEATAKVR